MFGRKNKAKDTDASCEATSSGATKSANAKNKCCKGSSKSSCKACK